MTMERTGHGGGNDSPGQRQLSRSSAGTTTTAISGNDPASATTTTPIFLRDFHWRDTRHLISGVVPRESGYRLINPEFVGVTWFPPQASRLPGVLTDSLDAAIAGVAPRLSCRGLLVAQVTCCDPAALVLSDIRTRSYALNEEHQVVVALTLPGMTWSGLTVRV
jgi:hypothetical protein